MNDADYIRRCLQIAQKGLGHVRPNPLVGCVVVKDGTIVSEGYHQEIGHNHAERNALLRPGDYHGATLYVNLEPCSHHGLTPPCADFIVEKGIAKVVCCNDDPNPLVDGGGFAKLRNAGIEVVQHVLEHEGRELNRRFFTFMEKKRPYIILKWAQSSDGFIASSEGSAWLSTQAQNRLNHRWRTEEAAILIGSETFIKDNPQLTPRHYLGLAPQPVVLDRRNRTNPPNLWLKLDSPTIEEAVQTLYERKVQSVIVEGGRKILDAFISGGLYDEVRVLLSPTLLRNGIKAPVAPKTERLYCFDYLAHLCV